MVVYGSMANMARGVGHVQNDTENGLVEVFRVKNRFSNPMGGWSDVLLNLRFQADVSESPLVPFEVQLVHRAMLILRHDLGGHEAYAKFRFAAEFLEFTSAGMAAAQEIWQVERTV